jgi:predicted XRE-type DNA-binding protein
MQELETMSKEEDIKKGTSNVFDDIGVTNPTQALAKAELARQIAGAISKRKLTQQQAAKLLGIDQAKISALSRGQLRGFSTDRLFRLLNKLGHDVVITVHAKPKSREQAQVRVVGL